MVLYCGGFQLIFQVATNCRVGFIARILHNFSRLMLSEQTDSERAKLLVRVAAYYIHNILSNLRADIGKYVVSWLKHSRENNRRYPDQS